MKQVSFAVLFVLLICVLSIGMASATCTGKNNGVENSNASGGDEGEDVDTLVAPIIAAAGRELLQEGYKYAKKKGWDKKLKREVGRRLKKGAKQGLRKLKNLFGKKRKGHKKRGGHKKRRHYGGARTQAYESVQTKPYTELKCLRCRRVCSKYPTHQKRLCILRCKKYCYAK